MHKWARTRVEGCLVTQIWRLNKTQEETNENEKEIDEIFWRNISDRMVNVIHISV
jgi:hypothetical protein